MSKTKQPDQYPRAVETAANAPAVKVEGTRFPGEERCGQDSQMLRPVGTRWERIHNGKQCTVEVVKHVYDKGSYSWSERVEQV